MTAIHRAGLVINPAAGQGFAHSAACARQVIARLGCMQIVTGTGQSGAAALTDPALKVETVPDGGLSSRALTQALVTAIAQAGVDGLFVVGGDGTLADSASALVRAGSTIPIFGLGTGSTNAGGLVTCKASEMDALTGANLALTSVPALLPYWNDQLLGLGFNDCVLGFTVVATIDGRLRDVAVAEKFLGLNVPGEPAPMGTQKTRVWLLGSGVEREISRGPAVGTVIIGLAESPFIAKALTGGVCLASFTGIPAGCLVADIPLVQVELSAQEVLSLPPIHTTYASLDESMQVCVTGCKPGTGLCVDGNPLCLLSEEDVVRFTVRPSALHVFRVSSPGK
jgi:hypothetical protein